jgi:hypothetical protein
MPTGAFNRLACVPSIGVFYDGINFFSHLRATYDYIDAITYTCQDFRLCPKVSRLIVGVSHISKRTEVGIRPSSGYKTLAGLHTKLYLGYKRNKLVDAFVGSQNLVSPTLCEIIVRTNSEQRDYLARYFESLWSDTKSKIVKT